VSMTDLIWDGLVKRYRSKTTHRILTDAQMIVIRDGLADSYEARMVALVADYTAGRIATVTWEDRFLTLIVEAASHGFVFGRGGAALMTNADWDELAVTVAKQTSYGGRFLSELEASIDAQRGTTPLKAIRTALEARTAARASLYAGAAVEGYERGHAAAQGTPTNRLTLPVYPADGGTTCMSRCRCNWIIKGDEEARVWNAHWQTEHDEKVCDGCKGRGELYASVTVPM
jgi:hypothetical protein